MTTCVHTLTTWLLHFTGKIHQATPSYSSGCVSMATCVLVWSLLPYVVGGINEDIPDPNSTCGLPNTTGICSQDCNCGCWITESGCDPCTLCPENHECWKFCRHYLDDLDRIRPEDATVEFSKNSSNSLDKDGTSDLVPGYTTTVANESKDTNNVLTRSAIALIALLLVFVLCALLICYVVKRKTNLRRTNLPEVSNDSSTDTSDEPLLGPEPGTTVVGKVKSMETSFSEVSEVSEQQYRGREGKKDQDMQSVNRLIEGMNAETLSSEQRENEHRGNEDLESGMWSIKHQVHGSTGQEKEQSGKTSLSESQKPVENTYPQEDRQSQASGGDEVGQELQTEEQEEIKQFHPSKQSLIYDQLKKIDWVMGYYSAGESIEVYLNLGSLDPHRVEQQLADITGADISKFHARQDKQPEFDY